jgi:hypothetical protein
MSYDIHVFSVLRPNPAELGLEPDGKAFVLRTSAWQIRLERPLQVEPEDLYEGVEALLPGIQFQVAIHLEGEYTRSQVAKAKKIARDLAKQSLGVVVDGQDGTLATPAGVSRLPQTSRAARDDTPDVSLSWYFTDCLIHDKLPEFLRVLERYVPEAVPRRYDLIEPPQFKFKVDGRDRFLEFLHTNLHDLVVWYPSEPCRSVCISVPEQSGPTRQGYRVGNIALSLSAGTLQSPGWRVALERAWLATARLVTPFYAEIRVAGAGIRSWWWNGVPPQTGVEAVLVGPPYLEIWPEFVTASQQVEGMPCRYAQRPALAPPPDIAQPESKRVELDPVTGEVLSIYHYTSLRYPSRWPFEGPFAPPDA